jgi:hypothetical protein
MRFFKVVLDVTILVTVLFLVVIGGLFLIESCFPDKFIKIWTERFNFCLGIVALLLAALISYLFVKVHHKRILTVSLAPKAVDIECAIIQEYVKKYFYEHLKIFPVIAVGVGAKNQIQIMVEELIIDDEAMFDKIEKELGALFAVKLGYFKPFHLHFSKGS